MYFYKLKALYEMAEEARKAAEEEKENNQKA